MRNATDIQMRPDYQTMVAAETPQPPPIYLQTSLRAEGAGSATLKVVEPASAFDEARWLVERCGYRL